MDPIFGNYTLRVKKYNLILLLYIVLATLCFVFVAYDDIYNATEQVYTSSSLRFYADHPTYVNDYRNYKDNLLLFLAFRPNYVGPFFVIWLIGDNLLRVFIFNIFCLILSIRIIFLTKYFKENLFLLLLLINPITFLSLFSINKEILALLSMSFFIYSLIQPKFPYIFIGLLFSFLAKKELTFFIVILYGIFYLIPRWNQYKYYIYILFISLISVGSYFINKNFNAISEYAVETQTAVTNAGSGGTILVLNELQNRYGYFLVIIPKVFLNLYGSVLSRTGQMIDFKDVYNDVVVWGQSFLFLFVLPFSIYIQWKKSNLVASKLFFSFIISCILFSYIPVVQNRYFYSSYIILVALISIKKSNFWGNKSSQSIGISLKDQK
ncbi:hypothetical protein [Spirosoma pulveris]